MMLHMKHRPKTWDQLAGHKRLKTVIARMLCNGGLGGKAFLLMGSSGLGKSTAASLIAQDVCDADNVIELDAARMTPAKIDELEHKLRSYCIGSKTGRAIIINEAHQLTKETMTQLLITLERIPPHVCWVLTSMTDGQKTLFSRSITVDALASRCIRFDLRPDVDGFAEYAMRVAEDNGLGGATLSEYVDLVKRCKCNLRDAISRIEAGEMIREALVA